LDKTAANPFYDFMWRPFFNPFSLIVMNFLTHPWARKVVPESALRLQNFRICPLPRAVSPIKSPAGNPV